MLSFFKVNLFIKHITNLVLGSQSNYYTFCAKSFCHFELFVAQENMSLRKLLPGDWRKSLNLNRNIGTRGWYVYTVKKLAGIIYYADLVFGWVELSYH